MAGAQTAQWTTQDVAHSFALWWRDAGLHSLASDLPHGWMDESAAIAPTMTAPAPRLAEPRAAAPARPEARPAPLHAAPAARRAMPDELSAFVDWLANDPAQPEASWSGAAFLPAARVGARLLVIADMPDAGAQNGALPFAPNTAQFLAAMLGAIGLSLGDVTIAPLALRRPPGGLLDDATHAALAMRLRHYLGLALPRAALILGDRTCRALVAPGGAIATGTLPQIEHGGGRMPVAALPSADHLMRRPPAKAASWQALRLLAGQVAP